MPLIDIEPKTHIDLKRLALDDGKNIKETGNEAVLIGIEKMRERLEATLKKRKASKK